MDLKELIEELRELAKPIDFAGLEKDGVIEKSGNWYIIHRYNELPQHVLKKSRKVDETGRQYKMQFDDPSTYEKLLAKLEVRVKS